MPKETYYKYSNGQRIKMTNREVKAYIMKVNKWTTEQYNKTYDILRNKVRAYEAYERSSGRKVTPQSVQSLLFKEAKTKRRMGSDYQPSIKMQRIRSFTSVSSGKKGQQALTGKLYRQRRARTYEDATYKQFRGLIDSNQQAKDIYNAIIDPVKREQALAEFANKLGAKINEQDEVNANEAIPFGETYGSTDAIDFDIDAYL